MSGKFEVTFLGTNGSCSYNAGSRVKYGTNSLCVAVMAGEEVLIFDSGSGVCGFQNLAEYQREHIHMFFSHYHIDHIGGLPFYSQLFERQKRFDIYGGQHGRSNFNDLAKRFLSPPLHPVGLDVFQARLDFNTVQAGKVITLSDGVTVRPHNLAHPGVSIGYRVEYQGKAFCYCTDVELGVHQNDYSLLEFMRGADLLVLDSFFDDGKVLSGWGHSSWKECAEWAILAGVKKLALFHYSFNLTDAEIDAMEEKAKLVFPGAFASADYMQIKL